ncbi:MAG: DUF1549 domain-containing protein, partial [Planctomycetes bacterium]|nr:DUF1549 domain-containing protein [Planctomycetota bacterium]
MQPSILALALIAGQASPPDEAFFEAKIRPVLLESCFQCHGGMKVSNKLRVDSRDALLAGGRNGPAIMPGKADKSLLLQAIRHAHADFKMPPGKKLPAHVIKDFADWIDRGAAWPKSSQAIFKAQEHWAFRPVKSVPAPDDPTGWATHPIDRHIAAKLREQGLKPVGPADTRTLLRRVTFDLTGLPTTAEETARTLASAKPQAAWQETVDRLLASPRYGERWGRHWMD